VHSRYRLFGIAKKGKSKIQLIPPIFIKKEQQCGRICFIPYILILSAACFFLNAKWEMLNKKSFTAFHIYHSAFHIFLLFYFLSPLVFSSFVFYFFSRLHLTLFEKILYGGLPSTVSEASVYHLPNKVNSLK